jgi:outer membrane lipoprotein carrier protein
MLINTKFLNVLFLLLLLQTPFAEAARKPVAQLKNFLTTTKTLTANFKQVLYDESGKAKQTSYGVFNLSRPGKFRWDYQKPFLQEIVSNSGKVWFYDADLEQVTIKNLDKSMGSTPALLLTGDVEIEKEFTIENQGDDEGMQWIKLVPKNAESNFKYVLIGLNEGVLGGMELSDNFGQLTRIYFSEVNLNPQLKADEFVFTVPKGVDVMEDKPQEKAENKVENKPEHKVQDEAQDQAPVDEQLDEPVVSQGRSHTPIRPHLHSQDHGHAQELSKGKTEAKTKDKAKNKNEDKNKNKDKGKGSKTKSENKAKSTSEDKDKSKSKDKSKDKNENKSKSKSSDKHKDKHK